MKLTTIRVVLGIVAAENLHLKQLDVKTTFLHGDLEEDIYMQQLEGFAIQGKENQVCKLKKSLYDLKQAPSLTTSWVVWGTQDAKLIVVVMSNILTTPTSFYYYIWMICWLQDPALRRLTSWNNNCQNSLKWRIWELLNKYLAWELSETDILKFLETKYVKKVLSMFNMDNATPVSTPLGNHLQLSKDQSPKTELECGYC